MVHSAAEAMAGGSMWASMTSCLTPTTLFCILNLTIVTIYITSTLKKLGQSEPNSHPQLVRVPSLFERVKSFNRSIYRSEQEQPDPVPEREQETHVTRSRSDACVNAPATKPARVLKKSVSEKVRVAEPEVEEECQPRPSSVREAAPSYVEDEAVDAKADDFINRFKQQLKLQRLDSILRYKEMLNRGSRN